MSIVIPAKNEQDNIMPLVRELIQVLRNSMSYEIVYVDDGSEDATYQRIAELAKTLVPQLRVIKHQTSVGQSTAIMTGIFHAKGELIVTMDADGQNDPMDIPKMLLAAKQFDAETHFCIAGYRRNRKDTAWKRAQSRIANYVRSALLGDDTPDTGCGLKIFPRNTFLKLPYFDHMHRFLPALVKRLGGQVVVFEVNHRERRYGISKYNMLGRLGVGIIDLLGVIWLQRRSKIPLVVSHEE